MLFFAHKFISGYGINGSHCVEDNLLINTIKKNQKKNHQSFKITTTSHSPSKGRYEDPF